MALQPQPPALSFKGNAIAPCQKGGLGLRETRHGKKKRMFEEPSFQTSGTRKRLGGLAPRTKDFILSVAIPCMNEEEILPRSAQQLISALERGGFVFELIFIDDGSTDATPEVLRELHEKDSRIRVLRLSRNFGHQVAITAGLENATGDAVAVMDADLQHPPEILLSFVEKWREGYDVAYGVRAQRDTEKAFKVWTAKLFYHLISRLSDTRIPLDSGDFRLMDRRVVDALLSMPERDRFLRGMVSWLGFSQIGVPYYRGARTAGETKFTPFRMLRFAADAIFSFSVIPLRMATWTGFFASGLAIFGVLYTMYERLLGNGVVKGWTSTVIAVLFLGGVQLIALGIIGEYVGRIYGESKRRPLYLVRERIGFEHQQGCESVRSR